MVLSHQTCPLEALEILILDDTEAFLGAKRALLVNYFFGCHHVLSFQFGV
jgi:hypothetical protein